MNCYKHSDTAAIGVCKTCNRGVCTSCANEAELHITCSSACAEEAAAYLAMSTKARNIYGIGMAKRRLPLAPVMWFVLGVLFVTWSAYLYFAKHRFELFPLAFGAFAIVFAWMAYRRTKELDLNC